MRARFLLPARHELNKAVQRYNQERECLGDEFRDQAWETVQRIIGEAHHPLTDIRNLRKMRKL